MSKSATLWILLSVVNLMSRPAWTEERLYAVVIGNNAAPDASLATLRYADDDAVRFFRFIKAFSNEVHLLTVPDGKTQVRYLSEAREAMVPTFQNLERLVASISRKVVADHQKGHTSVLYIFFSGHGSFGPDGKPFLSLYGGGLTHDKLLAIINTVNADYVHLFVDACYAEGLVGSRGMFDNEADSRHIQLSDANVRKILGKNRLTDLPGLGVIMASSEYQKTHEWSQLESGIFTHEVLSGLSGPADINHDGKIEYSELAAFIAAANREVNDERGKIKVVAKPPDRDHGFPIVDMNMSSETLFWMVNTSTLGRFYIELENGERYLDANLTDSKKIRILLPTDQKAYLTVGEKEAELSVGFNHTIDVALLRFEDPRFRPKGPIESAFRKGLFQAPYNRSYYKGFVDSTGFLSVKFDFSAGTPAKDAPSALNLKLRRAFAFSCFSIAAVSAITAIVFGTLALKTRNDFFSTDYEVSSVELNNDYESYSMFFWPLAAMAPIAAISGWLLMPKKRKQAGQDVKVSIVGDRVGISQLKLRF